MARGSEGAPRHVWQRSAMSGGSFPSSEHRASSCFDSTLMLSDMFHSLRAFWFPQILRQSPALGGLRRTLPRGFCISRLLALKKRHVRQPQNIGFKLQPSAFLFWWLQHVATFRFGLTRVTSVVLLNIPFSSIFLLM